MERLFYWKRLTLNSLAGHYNVSLTPVRTAVAELIDEGLLERDTNHRLVATAPGGKRARRHPEPKLPEPPQNPYEVIASDLVQLSLQGKSIYLREETTAEQYDISRSAIRNILHRLAGERVVDHIPRRGWRLRPFRQGDLRSFIEIREVLEQKALELARPKLDAGRLKHMLGLNVPPAITSTSFSTDESLHEYLISIAGNPYIRDFLDREGRYYRLLFEATENRDIVIETMRQHHEILTALLKKNWPAARKALSHHLLDNQLILD